MAAEGTSYATRRAYLSLLTKLKMNKTPQIVGEFFV
jgi:hypothetical protein